MRKQLSKYQKILILLVVPILFLIGYMLGTQEPDLETLEDEPIEDYTALQPSEAPADPMPKKKDIKVPGQHDRKEAIDIASAFVMAFHAVDSKKPYQYLEDSKQFMTEDAFEKVENIPKRGTLEVPKLEPTGTDVLPIDLRDTFQIWRVGVTSLQGEEYVFTEYQIELVKEGQEWKVDGVKIND